MHAHEPRIQKRPLAVVIVSMFLGIQGVGAVLGVFFASSLSLDRAPIEWSLLSLVIGVTAITAARYLWQAHPAGPWLFFVWAGESAAPDAPTGRHLRLVVAARQRDDEGLEVPAPRTRQVPP